MPKYAIMGGYTAEAWARFIENPGDRSEAVSKAVGAVGGKLDSIYWCFGEDDFLVIADCPDDVAAAGVSVAVGSSGALRNTRTIKLIEASELRQVLAKAKTAAAVYVPPGVRQPAGVG
jgi:uncharacterized protein with GYD domain